MLMLIAHAAAYHQTPTPCRRALVDRRAALHTAAVATLLLPTSRATAKELDADRLAAGVAALDGLLRDWKELVTDCTYAEVPRELLEQKNKEKLLKAASTFSTFDKSASINVCKSSNRVVRQVLEKMPTGKQMQSPSLAGSVREEDFEGFLAAAEKVWLPPSNPAHMVPASDGPALASRRRQYENALNAADAAAFLSATGDYSARTSFQVGEEATTPNLDASRENVLDARDALKVVLQLVRAGPAT